MSNQLMAIEPNLPSTDNPYLAAAADTGGGMGKLLKFVKGKWETGDDEIPVGTEHVAHADQIARGWLRFDDNKVVEQYLGKVVDGFMPPRREDLSDTDPANWEIGLDGRPRDPWTMQWYLPLTAVKDSEFLTFVTGSKGGISAVGTLCRIYGRRQCDGALPVIKLGVRSYRHHQYGRIEMPDLPIVGWEGAAAPAPAPTVEHTGVTLDDDIPF